MTYEFSDKEKLKTAIYDYEDGVYEGDEEQTLVGLCTRLKDCSDKLQSYTAKVFMGNINKIYLDGVPMMKASFLPTRGGSTV